MKKVSKVNKVLTMWFTYFADHVVKPDEDLKEIPSLTFDNEDQAIGAAQALLITTKGVYYTCVIKTTKYVDDEELYSELIWEAEATDEELDSLFSDPSKQYS